MKESFGTNFVTGLNVGEAPHLITDDQLVGSYNGWTDQDGVWSPAPGPVRKYTGYAAISCMAAGRMNGADHVVWMDGNTLYDNGASVGTITTGTSMDIVALDDSFLIFGADKNYIWDGHHLREQGTWQPDYVYSANTKGTGSTSGAPTISAITLASPCVITLSSNTFHVGDRVYITGITGTTQLNARYFTVTASTLGVGGKITIDEDSTGHTAWSSGGTVNGQTDISGAYKFYITTTITMSDGRVLESRPRGLLIDTITTYPITRYNLGPTGTYDPSVLDISPGDHVVLGVGHSIPLAYFRMYYVRSGVTQFTISGTAGSDYIRGVRLYRTKANGSDFYLEREYSENDSDVSTFTDAYGSGIELPLMHVGAPDGELGAVYTPGNYDNGNAPAASTGDVSAQRCLVNDTANPDRVYWSSLDGIEYFNTSTGWDKRPDTVTAIIGWRDGWCVFSSDRMWFMRIIDGLPDWIEIQTPVGTVWPRAMWTLDGGVAWLRDDGLWFWGGSGSPEKISWNVFDSIIDPQSVTGAGSVLYVSGSEKAYVGLRRKQGWVWHECDGSYPYASGTNGSVYAASDFAVVKLFSGTRSGGRLKSKHFGNKLQGRAVRVRLDMEGETVPTLWINGNRQSDTDGHSELARPSEYGRKIALISVPKLNNQFVELQFDTTGDVRIYGYEIEVAR